MKCGLVWRCQTVFLYYFFVENLIGIDIGTSTGLLSLMPGLKSGSISITLFASWSSDSSPALLNNVMLLILPCLFIINL